MEFLVYFIIGFLAETSFFEITHHYYCWKNKGKCKNCRDWSCSRKQYLSEKGDLK